jgi:ubiquinone/menaquinone biosynthesis C-methylase UbiE
MRVLEIGCGRGDFALYLAKNVKSITGIDYSASAIRIAKGIQKKYPQKIQKKSNFFVMNATQLAFKDNSFDLILLIDTFDHLDSEEQIKLFKEITRVLKNGGKLYMRTCTNRYLLCYTYKYYTYPVNRLLTSIDKTIKRTHYDSLPIEPRPKEEKHVIESTYIQIRRLFKQFHFEGTIRGEPGFSKEGNGLRTKLYNFVLTLSPLSKYFPLSIFFAYTFICNMQLHKKNL